MGDRHRVDEVQFLFTSSKPNMGLGDFTRFGLRGRRFKRGRGFESHGHDPTRLEAAQHEGD